MPKFEIVNDDDDLSTPMNPEFSAAASTPDDDPLADGSMCEVCGKGPFKRIAAHMTKAHGENAAPAGRKAKKSLEDDLGSMLAALAMAVSLFEPYDGMVISQNAPPVARAWSNLAMQNPRVDRMLRSMMGGVSYGEVIMATAGMILPILAHHRLLPEHINRMLAPMESSSDAGTGG